MTISVIYWRLIKGDKEQGSALAGPFFVDVARLYLFEISENGIIKKMNKGGDPMNQQIRWTDPLTARLPH
ncbi:hypothetical protein [Enterococcus canis]|uniref:hypothetical protein n=1 Tax=Enterococcus canis TaxID=214095 RepID=UPI001160CC0A|nr:hypothetical protein [Enterococcus canis]